MSISDVLRPDGSDYDPFLFADIGEDKTGATVTVLSALARLGVEPWTEARELALLSEGSAQTRLKAHLATISDIPALGLASGSVATKLVSLLPKHASRGVAHFPKAMKFSNPSLPAYWMLAVLIGILVLVKIYFLAHAG